MTLEQMQARLDELTGEKKALEAKVVELTGLLASGATAAEAEATKKERERADAAEAKVARFDETFQAAVRARAKLEREAATVLGAETRMDDLADRSIHELVVKRLDGSADVKSASDAELRGQYGVLISLANRNAASQQRVGEILGQTGNGSQAPRADEESYESMMKNAWKQKSRNAAAGAR